MPGQQLHQDAASAASIQDGRYPRLCSMQTPTKKTNPWIKMIANIKKHLHTPYNRAQTRGIWSIVTIPSKHLLPAFRDILGFRNVNGVLKNIYINQSYRYLSKDTG